MSIAMRGPVTLCLEIIAPGTRQYDIGAGLSTLIVDQQCSDSSVRPIIDIEPRIEENA